MILRSYTGEDGETHFEEPNLKWEEGENGLITPIEQVEGVRFRSHQPGVAGGFHAQRKHQYYVTISGHAEIGSGTGEKHIFGPGDVLLAEDFTGRGHTYRVVGDEPRVGILIYL